MSGNFTGWSLFEYLENLPEALGVRLVQIVFLFSLSLTHSLSVSLYFFLSLSFSLCVSVFLFLGPRAVQSHTDTDAASQSRKENCRPPQQQNN